jgi:hypothetical protein
VLGVTGADAKIDVDVSSLDPSDVLELPPECFDARLRLRIPSTTMDLTQDAEYGAPRLLD